MVEAVRYLAALGHRRIARVSGVDGIRPHAGANEGIPRRRHASSAFSAEVAATDYTPESGARATRRLLSSPEPPTAIIFDSDLLAVTGLGVAQQMGFIVPDDLSLIGWDDSLISRVVHPPLTAITRDIGAYGSTAAAPPAGRDRGHDARGHRGRPRRIDPTRQHRSAARCRARARPCGVRFGGRRGEWLFALCGKPNRTDV